MGPEYLEMPKRRAVPQLRVTKCEGTLWLPPKGGYTCVYPSGLVGEASMRDVTADTGLGPSLFS